MKRLIAVSALFAFLMLNCSMISAKAITLVEKEMGFVSVNTSASKEITPDTASISFSVITTSKDSKTAAEINNEITSRLVTCLKPLLHGEHDTIQTSNLNLRPDYTYDKDNKKTLFGYTMTNTVTVKTKDMEMVPKLVDVAIANKASSVSELRFFVENENTHVAQLIKEATKKAEDMANVAANSLGQKVKGIKNINVYWGPSHGTYDNVRLYNAKTAGAAMDESTPVEPGKVKIQATVNAQFYVK